MRCMIQLRSPGRPSSPGSPPADDQNHGRPGIERSFNAFYKLYSRLGRQPIAPERLICALLLQALYTIRSERQLVEQLDYNLLFRWFVGMTVDEQVWNHSVFSKNRDRLLAGDIAVSFLSAICRHAQENGLLSHEHFSVDGTMIEAWASMKSFRPRNKEPPEGGGRNRSVNFRGQKRKNDTHVSRTDPDARLLHKSQGDASRLVFQGHVLAVDCRSTIASGTASGTAEREAALEMAAELPGKRRKTMGVVNGYDREDFVVGLRQLDVTPHVAQRNWYSAIDERTTRHPGYRQSLYIRKQIEKIFGWLKTKHQGKEKVG